MPDKSSLWQLEGFEYHLDIWISLEAPEQELINEVLEWVLSRADDPYQGVDRDPQPAFLTMLGSW